MASPRLMTEDDDGGRDHRSNRVTWTVYVGYVKTQRGVTVRLVDAERRTPNAERRTPNAERHLTVASHESGTPVPCTGRRRFAALLGNHPGSRRLRTGLAGRRRRWRLSHHESINNNAEH